MTQGRRITVVFWATNLALVVAVIAFALR